MLERRPRSMLLFSYLIHHGQLQIRWGRKQVLSVVPGVLPNHFRRRPSLEPLETALQRLLRSTHRRPKARGRSSRPLTSAPCSDSSTQCSKPAAVDASVTETQGQFDESPLGTRAKAQPMIRLGLRHTGLRYRARIDRSGDQSSTSTCATGVSPS